MNKAYRLLWNKRLNAWVVVCELARACGKRSAGRVGAGFAAVLLALSASGPLVAADLAPGALPSGGVVASGQAAFATSGNRLDVTQGSQRAIINWTGFDIGSQAQVNFAQPNASAVALNRVRGPNATRIEGQLSANGQVFLVNPNGVLFGGGARVNVGALAASTLNIRDEDFIAGNYSFTGHGGAIENRGTISAAPGGYLAFIAPQITNSGTLSAPRGTVAMGAGERVTLNFSGDRLVGLSVSAETIDTLITNSQAIRAEGGAILLSAAGAEAVTRSVINNTGVLEASSLNEQGGRIVLSAGNDINLGPASTVAVNGTKGGEIELLARSGTLLVDGRFEARGVAGTGGRVKLLGERVGLVNAAQVDASGATGGGTVLVGGDYQGKNSEVQNAQRTYVSSGASIKADATERGDGGKVVVWSDGDTRYYGTISAQGGKSGGDGGFVEISGKQNLDFNGGVNVGAVDGVGGRVLLDPQNIVLNTAVAPPPTNNPNGTPDIAFADPPAVGTTNVQISTVTGFSELFLQATNDITVSNPVAMAANNSIRLEANNNITLAAGANVSTSGTGFINFKADADNSGAGTLAMNNATLTSNVGGITLSGAIISGTGTISTTGAASANGGNLSITGTSAAGNINLAGAITSTGGTAGAGTPGRNAGNVTIAGAGAVTTGTITANGSAGNGANQPGGNGGTISVTSNGALLTTALQANGGNGVATAAGGNAGTITVANNGALGTLTTGTLTARTGAAAGAIVSGSAGSISVNNIAATLLQTGAIDTSGQAGGAGGNVTLTSAGGVTVTGTITTSGGVANLNTPGPNAGTVTLAGDSVTTLGITANGANGNTTGAGGNGGNVSVTGTANAVTVGAISTIGGNGVGGNSAGGNAGSITLDAGATTPTITLGGNLTATGGNRVGAGVAGSGGQIWLKKDVLLNTAAVTAAAGGGSAGVGTGANVRFDGAINSSGGARALTVNTNANTTFSGAVGAFSALSSLTTDAGGTTAINGGAVTTTGAQAYNDNVTLGAPTALSTTNNNITVAGAVNAGGNTLTLAAGTGNVSLANVGNNFATVAVTSGNNVSLTDIDAINLGTANVAGTLGVTANGAITQSGALAVTGATTLAAGAANDITLNNAINNFGTVAVTNGNNVLLRDTNAIVLGASTVSGTLGVTANGAITQTGALAVTGVTTLAAGAVNDITLNNAGNDFGTVAVTNGNNVLLRDTNAIVLGSSTVSGTLGVTANGAITQTGAIAVTGGTTLTATGAANDITLNNALNDFSSVVWAGRNVDLRDANNLLIDGSIAATGSLSLTAGGTLTLSGNGSNRTLSAATNMFLTAQDLVVGNPFQSINYTVTAPNMTVNVANDFTIIGRSIGAVGGFTRVTGTTSQNVTVGNKLELNMGAGATGSNNFAQLRTTGAGSQVINAGSIVLQGSNTNPGGRVSIDAAGQQTITTSGNIALTGGSTNGATARIQATGTGAQSVTSTNGSIVLTNGAGVGSLAALSGSTTNTSLIQASNGTIGANAGTSISGNDVTLRAPAVNLSGDLLGTGANSFFRFDLPAAGSSVNQTGGTLSATQGVLTGSGTFNLTAGSNDFGTLSANGTGTANYRDSNAVLLGASSFTGNVAVAAGGNITQSGSLSVTGASSFTTSVAGADVVLNNPSNIYGGNVTASTTGAGSDADIRASGNLVFAASSVGGSLTGIATGNLTLNGDIDAGAGGDAIVLAAGASFNNSGNFSLTPGTGRWLVYSTNPASDTRGASLLAAYDFKQYNTALGGAILGSGDGFIYTIAPIITPGLTGTVSKTYDATNAATLVAANYTASGAIDGDTVTLNNPAAGTYDDKNVGTGKAVTASGILLDSANNGVNPVFGYQLGSGSATAAIGTITAAPLALNAVTDTRVYDATTSSSGAVATLGLQGTDTVTALSQSYLSKNVLGPNASTLAVNAGYAINDGNSGNNYSVTTNTAAGTISAASLTITADDKSRPVDTPNPPFTASYSGLVGGDTPADLNGVLAFSTSANMASPAGAYSIRPFGQTSSNYVIAYVDGVLQIVARPTVPDLVPVTQFDPQAIAARYSDLEFALCNLPVVRYALDCAGPTVRIVGTGLRLGP